MTRPKTSTPTEAVDVTQEIAAFNIESPDNSVPAAAGPPVPLYLVDNNDVAQAGRSTFSVAGAIRKGLNFAKSVIAGLRSSAGDN